MFKIIYDFVFYVCCCGGRYINHSDSPVDIAKESAVTEYNELLDHYRAIKQCNKNNFRFF
jgi:hypothetical protein